MTSSSASPDPADRPVPGDTLPLDAAGQGAPSPNLPTIGHIGRYVLKFKVGQGGLGTVFAAYDPLLSRLIAIKTVTPRGASGERESFNTHFLHEARAAASLSHPHIVTVFDAGVSPQGAYIAMELLKGRDLRQMRHDGLRSTPVQAALIVRRVADALSYAHGKGVIHCDVKPANIYMVSPTQPKVLDFGIARIVRPDDSEPGKLVGGGSPRYMAPEQLRGDPLDRRCDVYSLGVVLYELLTDRNPYARPTLNAIVQAVLHHEPPLASQLDPSVPPSLAAIVARAMQKDPADRYQSARVFSRDLRRWLDSELEGSEGRDTGTDPVGLTKPGALSAYTVSDASRDTSITAPPQGQGPDAATHPPAGEDSEPAAPIPATTEAARPPRRKRATEDHGWTITGLAGLAVVALIGLLSLGDLRTGPRPATHVIEAPAWTPPDVAAATPALPAAPAQAAAQLAPNPSPAGNPPQPAPAETTSAVVPANPSEPAATDSAPSDAAPEPAAPPAAEPEAAPAPLPTLKLSPKVREVVIDPPRKASPSHPSPARLPPPPAPPPSPPPAAGPAPSPVELQDAPGFASRTAKLAPVSTAIATRLGFVDVYAPPSAQIEIDGTPAGTAAPNAKLRMTEGEHVITLRRPGFPAHEARVNVSEGRRAALVYRFEK